MYSVSTLASGFAVVSLSLAAGSVAAQSSGPGPTNASDPWADRVVFYDPGTGANPTFTDPNAALGEPTRITDPGFTDPGPVTPFFGAAQGDQVVTLGAGGVLTLMFDEPVRDDAFNPFGIDLLVFGNAFLFDLDFPNGVAGPPFAEGGIIEISADGSLFVEVPSLFADGSLFPTLAQNADGSLTDFTLPVDPLFDPAGLGIAGIAAGYAGSGGGVGIDIGAFGFSEISYVRITNPLDATDTPEIDAVADVAPAPGGMLLLAGAAGLATRRRRASTSETRTKSA
ncbi:MAG: hypothetical protein AAF235_05720 [Planctomycetota bacterium]